VEWFIAVVVVAALGVAAIVAAGGLGSMSADSTRDVFRQDLPGDRPLTGRDLQRLRFGVALRGYSMAQVDDVLDRLSGELATRDQRIADLEALLADRGIASAGPHHPIDPLDRTAPADRTGFADRTDFADSGGASVPGPEAETLR